jgi:6-phosphogluconolactonase
MAHVYVSNADSGDVSVLDWAADGRLRLQSTVKLGGNLMPMALSPCRRMLYVARRSEPMAVLSLAIDPQSGALHRVGESALPASMAYISTDIAGRFVLAASYPGHRLSVSPVAQDGTVGAVQQVVPTAPHAHAIVASPCNRHVLATSLGGGEIMVYGFHGTLDVLAWDAQHGRLKAVQSGVDILPPGFAGQPWAADLHLTPDGRHLYASERTSSTLAHWTVDADTGALTLQGHTAVETQPRGFAIDPSGRYLLVAGQLSHHLGCYAMDPVTGQLRLQQRIAVGQGPNWVEILA